MKRFISVILTAIILISTCILASARNTENNYKNKGVLINDLIGHAQSQVGYKSDTDISAFNKTGTAKDNWSTDFLSWCAYNADISDESIPYYSTPDLLYEFYHDNSLIYNTGYLPVAGDIIFINDSEKITLCGIITASDETTVTAIIGDEDEAVKKKIYDITLSKISGYAKPDYKKQEFKSISGYITTPITLNLRSEMNTQSKILTTIPMGTILKISEIKDNWGKTSFNEYTGYVSMDYIAEYDITHKNAEKYSVKWNVIDISKYQNEIDWNTLQNNDISAIIIRIGFRGTLTKVIHEDEKFIEYYKKAKESGYHVGCYFYSGATTVAEATEEAEFIAKYIADNSLTFDMPVYWDVEDKVIKATGKENICNMTAAFFKVMEDKNIYSGVYTSSSWMTDYFNPALFSDHPLWIADWRGYVGYTGDYGMWQYTENGQIEGVKGNVDMNYCYINYPELIKDKKYNTDKFYKEPESESQDYLLGDINSDNKITASDARTVLRIAASLEKISDDKIKIADYNKDNKITASDARLILRKSAKLD